MAQNHLGSKGPADPPESPVSAAAQATDELRAAPRFTLLIRAAKLIADGREYLCIIRDASATGIKVRLFHPLPTHRNLHVELGNGVRHALELVWSTQDHAGFRFCEEIEIERLLDESHGAFPKRHVRLRIALQATVHSGGDATPVSFEDISQQGGCIQCDKWLLMNELVRVDTGIMPPIYAKVRWRSHPRYGLLFERTFKLDELARISAPLQLSEAISDAAAEQPAKPRQAL
ncbi:PilZ domain-containing protein [Novosphingobium lentum]|uniref:PilZ domain-containing protein n=1 Tax=Novosphingobium lentum TaxID=145287 RepID=UPI001FDFC61F|nr:PilZ domain-containing protein [Novosphingobium lentum]